VATDLIRIDNRFGSRPFRLSLGAVSAETVLNLSTRRPDIYLTESRNSQGLWLNHRLSGAVLQAQIPGRFALAPGPAAPTPDRIRSVIWTMPSPGRLPAPDRRDRERPKVFYLPTRILP
jgi:hypothetical protein